MPPRKKTQVPPLSDLLPTVEMAAHCKRTPRTLHRWAEAGLLRKYYIGSRLMWSKSEVGALVTTVQPPAAAASADRLAEARSA